MVFLPGHTSNDRRLGCAMADLGLNCHYEGGDDYDSWWLSSGFLEGPISGKAILEIQITQLSFTSIQYTQELGLKSFAHLRLTAHLEVSAESLKMLWAICGSSSFQRSKCPEDGIHSYWMTQHHGCPFSTGSLDGMPVSGSPTPEGHHRLKAINEKCRSFRWQRLSLIFVGVNIGDLQNLSKLVCDRWNVGVYIL